MAHNKKNLPKGSKDVLFRKCAGKGGCWGRMGCCIACVVLKVREKKYVLRGKKEFGSFIVVKGDKARESRKGPDLRKLI